MTTNTRTVTETLYFNAKARDFSDTPARGYRKVIVTKRQDFDPMCQRWMTAIDPISIEPVKE